MRVSNGFCVSLLSLFGYVCGSVLIVNVGETFELFCQFELVFLLGTEGYCYVDRT